MNLAKQVFFRDVQILSPGECRTQGGSGTALPTRPSTQGHGSQPAGMSGLRSDQLPEEGVLAPTGTQAAMGVSFLGAEDLDLKGPNPAASRGQERVGHRNVPNSRGWRQERGAGSTCQTLVDDEAF